MSGLGNAGKGHAAGKSSAKLRGPRYWPGWILVGLLRLLALLPFRWQVGMGRGLGRVAHRLARDRRNVARTNVRICLPGLKPAERNALVREHFQWLGVVVVTQGLLLGAAESRLRRLVRFKNREIVDERLARGQPMIMLGPHFVALDLGGTAFSALVHPGSFMYQRIRHPVIESQLNQGRTRFGSIAVERRDDLRALIRVIKSGVPFYYLPDQDPGRRKGLFVPFCGMAAATVPMLGRLAKMSGADVIPTFARFLPDGSGVEMRFEQPLEDFPSGDMHADTLKMNQLIEANLSAMPAQYFWVHRRFKTRPEGEPAIYPEPARRRRRRERLARRAKQ